MWQISRSIRHRDGDFNLAGWQSCKAGTKKLRDNATHILFLHLYWIIKPLFKAILILLLYHDVLYKLVLWLHPFNSCTQNFARESPTKIFLKLTRVLAAPSILEKVSIIMRRAMREFYFIYILFFFKGKTRQQCQVFGSTRKQKHSLQDLAASSEALPSTK